MHGALCTSVIYTCEEVVVALKTLKHGIKYVNTFLHFFISLDFHLK